MTLERLHMHDSDKEKRHKHKAFQIFYERVFKRGNTTQLGIHNAAALLQRESLLLHLIL